MRKKIQSLFMVTILLVSLAVTGCGSNKENAKESNTNATQDSTEIATKVVEKEESATVEEKEDGTIKITTDTGEEIEIASGSSEVKEEADGSKTYTTSDGRKVTVSSDGSATVTTKEVVEAETGKPVNTSGNTSNGGASNSNGSSNNSTSSSAGGSNNSGNSSSSTGNTETACSHSWKSATCTAPKTCTKCSATEGSAKGHTSSDWTVTKEATETTEGTKVKTCTVCGATLETASIAKVAHTCNYQWETNGNTRTMKCSCGATKGVTETCYNGYWGYYDSAMATELFNQCNAGRQEAQYVEYDAIGNIVYAGNVHAVSRDGSLDALATSRAVEVLSSWSHNGVTSYYNSENLAKGFDTAIDVRCAWAASHSHAATMTYQYYTRAGAAWFWYDQDGTGENLIGVAVMEYGE